MAEGTLFLVIALALVALALYVAVLLLRVSGRSLRGVFSRDRGLLRRRLLIGLADIAYAFFVGVFFFSGELGIRIVQMILAWACMGVFLAGLVLWLLAALQFIGLASAKEKQPPGPPAQSSP